MHPHWFSECTGFPEDGAYAEIQSRLRALAVQRPGWLGRYRHGELSMPSSENLLVQIPTPDTAGNSLRVTLEQGDVVTRMQEPTNAGCVFQVASQCNLLEMVHPGVTPEDGVTHYLWDHTQGPACAMATPAATIWRNYLVPHGGREGQQWDHQLDTTKAMRKVLACAMEVDPEQAWTMQNGYVMATSEQIARIDAALQDPTVWDAAFKALCMGWATHAQVAGAEHTVHLALCAALPLAYQQEAEPERWHRWASLVLEASYTLTLAAAWKIRAPRVYLTRLGGGAFGNESVWINAAMANVFARFSSVPLHVVLLCFHAPQPEEWALCRP